MIISTSSRFGDRRSTFTGSISLERLTRLIDVGRRIHLAQPLKGQWH